MAQKIIEVADLKKYYNGGAVHAMDGVTVDICRGDVIAVIGPSGGGKSTFLRSLNLLEVPTAGSIKVDGVEITGKKVDLPRHRQKMGMVFQHFNLFPHKTVLENLTMAPIRIKKVPKAEAEQKAMTLLGRVGLADRANDYPAQLSGGQKQRVAIVRALAMEPEVMLFDEPTSALDPISTMKIEDLALELKKNYTIIIVTHNMQQAVRISDQTAFFLLGELIEYSNTEQLFSQPKEEKTEDYITGRFG